MPERLFGHRKRKIGFPKSLLFGKRRNNGTDEIFANSGNSGVEFVTTRQRDCGIRRMVFCRFFPNVRRFWEMKSISLNNFEFCGIL